MLERFKVNRCVQVSQVERSSVIMIRFKDGTNKVGSSGLNMFGKVVE